MNDNRPPNICPCCNGSGIDDGRVRVIETLMRWDKDNPVRPLAFQRVDGGQSLVEIQDCDNTRSLFNYEPGFVGDKKRKVIVVES